jgi:hypothetical protein
MTSVLAKLGVAPVRPEQAADSRQAPGGGADPRRWRALAVSLVAVFMALPACSS